MRIKRVLRCTGSMGASLASLGIGWGGPAIVLGGPYSVNQRAEAEAFFHDAVRDPQFRLDFAIFAYRGALKLYAEGALDGPASGV